MPAGQLHQLVEDPALLRPPGPRIRLCLRPGHRLSLHQVNFMRSGLGRPAPSACGDTPLGGGFQLRQRIGPCGAHAEVFVSQRERLTDFDQGSIFAVGSTECLSVIMNKTQDLVRA